MSRPQIRAGGHMTVGLSKTINEYLLFISACRCFPPSIKHSNSSQKDMATHRMDRINGLSDWEQNVRHDDRSIKRSLALTQRTQKKHQEAYRNTLGPCETGVAYEILVAYG